MFYISLFDFPNICITHILYDIAIPNKISSFDFEYHVYLY